MPGICSQIGFHKSWDSRGGQTVSTGLEVRPRRPPGPGTRHQPWGHGLCHGTRSPHGTDAPSEPPFSREKSLLHLCFHNSQKKKKKGFYLDSRRCAVPREQSRCPPAVSSAVYPLLSYKRGILTPTPPLPLDQDPKITISSGPVNH